MEQYDVFNAHRLHIEAKTEALADDEEFKRIEEAGKKLRKKGEIMKIIFAILFLFFLLVGNTVVISQERIDTKPPDYVSSAKAFVDLLANKDFSSAEEYFDNTMKAALPEEKLKGTWTTIITQAVAFKRQVGTRTEEISGYKVVFVTCEFEKASIDIKVVLNQAKQVAGLFFVPANTAGEYSPPGYVKPNAFLEKEVTVGEGEWALPGTLTVPKEPGSYPAVVLVHGSGPNDRDETIGPNKPFRDLAWGLASQGIAVLRYEKRTRQYASKIGQLNGRFTVKEETIDDALAAVALLRKTEVVDSKKIFVLGHSLGGMLIPRIGVRDAGIAGFVVMAGWGATKPMEDTIIEQMTYIFSLEEKISDEEKKKLEEVKQLVTKIKNLKPSDASSSISIMGAPASYWLDLRGYDPPDAAKKLKQPLLILQGERDYQVTMVDFQRWKDALSSRRDVTFKSYSKMNHLFIEGNGRIAPTEYTIAGHVGESVIMDIAAWIKRGRE
jgi:hypothetical protein